MERIGLQTKARTQQGFGLVEVLVAIFIFLVALVGGAGLLTTAKRTEYDTYQRTMATQIGHAIIDRVRTNVGATPSYERTTPIGQGALGGSPARDCSSLTCNDAQLAAYDLWDLEQLLDGKRVVSGSTSTGGLVEPAACILHTARTGMTNTGRVRVIVSWEDRRSTSDAASFSVACGAEAAGTNPFRRQIVLDTFVLDPSEI